MLGRKSFMVTRVKPGSYVNGRWVEESTIPFEIKASKQPVSVNDLQSLEEGRRSSATYKFYTDTELFTADVTTGRNADKIEINSVMHEVIKVDPFLSGIISHYRVIVAKVAQ